jgi:hypothetical protein
MRQRSDKVYQEIKLRKWEYRDPCGDQIKFNQKITQ